MCDGVQGCLLEVLIERVVVLLQEVGAAVDHVPREVAHRELDVLPRPPLGHDEVGVLTVALVDRRAELDVSRLGGGGAEGCRGRGAEGCRGVFGVGVMGLRG